MNIRYILHNIHSSKFKAIFENFECMGALMDLEKLRLARSLYYQCLGELFVFHFLKKDCQNYKSI